MKMSQNKIVLREVIKTIERTKEEIKKNKKTLKFLNEIYRGNEINELINKFFELETELDGYSVEIINNI